MYADAQVYLLDDPLAAVDSSVASRLMERVIGPRGLLRDKVRVLATNHLGVLRDASEVVVLVGGEVAERGTFASLSAPDAAALAEAAAGGNAGTLADADVDDRPPEGPAGVFVRLLTIYEQGQGQVASAGGEPDAPEPTAAAAAAGVMAAAGAAVESADATGSGAVADEVGAPEERIVGRVAPEVFRGWLTAAGGVRAVPLAALAVLVAETFSVGSSWWLTRWGAAGTAASSLPYLAGYVALALCSAVLLVVRSVTTLSIGLAAGRRLHDGLLGAVVRAPMAVFDVTPPGGDRTHQDRNGWHASAPLAPRASFGPA